MKKNVKRLLSSMLSIIMLLGLVSCNSGKKKLSFTPGEYTAVSAGKNGDVKIKAVFDEESIVSVEVLESNETEGISNEAIERTIKSIVDGQTLEVDVTSGASLTTNAIVSAVEECVKQANGDVEALKNNKKEETASKKEETYDTDIVIVGGGAAGLTAAISASGLGAKVMVIEKGVSLAVSNGANAGGPIATGTKVQKAEGEDLTTEELFEHMSEFGNSTVNDALLRKTLEVTGETIDMLADLGLSVYLRQDAYGVGFRARHGIKEKGTDRMDFLADKIVANGGTIMLETTGEEVILDKDGNAVGIKATKADGTKVTINADAVLLATGGYLGGQEIIENKFGNITINPLGNTLSTGDGINMTLAAGGVEDKNWGIVANEFSASNSKAGTWSVNSNQNLRFGIYGGLLVNSEGNRFFNEEIMASEPLSGAEATLRYGKYYAVMDEAYYNSVCEQGIFKTLGSPENWIAGVRNLSDEAPTSKSHVKVLTEAKAQLQEAIDQGWAYKADTIEEIAEKFELENLVSTVEQYNKYCEAKYDSEFLKDPTFLTPVNNGPYYVFEYEPSAWCTIGGVKVDDSLRALDKNNEPIKGLYVAGVDAGSLFTAPYYDNEGSAFGLSLGSGTLAGRNMYKYIKENNK